MEFLKALFGENALTYAQLEQAIAAHNGTEANAQNQIKIGNLGGGEYVAKGKYDGIVDQLKGKQTELDTANGLIEELKKGTKADEALQGKITTYEETIKTLQGQLAEAKLKSALNVALLAAKAKPTDVDYLTFKLTEKLKGEGKTLELDDNDNIKGWNDHLSGLKTQFPGQFEAEGGGKKVLGGGGLPGNDEGGTITADQFHKMGYTDRLKLKNENPELFKQYTHR